MITLFTTTVKVFTSIADKPLQMLGTFMLSKYLLNETMDFYRCGDIRAFGL